MLNGLVIGAGMYTCGRGTPGYGTVLPALLQAARDEHLVEHLSVCATSRSSMNALAVKAAELQPLLKVDVPLSLFPEEGVDPQAYLKAIDVARKSGRPIDFAVVAVPDDQHYEIARPLLERDIHTLLVKPFVPYIQQARELIGLAEQRRLVAMVEFHKRWDQSNLLMRQALREGTIGDPLYFLIEYSQRKQIPEEVFIAWVRRTNVFQYLGVHYADMVYFLTGARPQRVMAIGQKAHLIQRGIDTWDSIQTLVQWEQDGRSFNSTHLTHWVDPNTSSAMSDQRIKVIGTQGRFECDQKNRGLHVLTDDRGTEHPNPYFSAFLHRDQETIFDGYGYYSIRAFLRAVSQCKRGGPPLTEGLPTFRAALVSTAIVEANNQSLSQGGVWVDVDCSL